MFTFTNFPFHKVAVDTDPSLYLSKIYNLLAINTKKRGALCFQQLLFHFEELDKVEWEKRSL